MTRPPTDREQLLLFLTGALATRGTLTLLRRLSAAIDRTRRRRYLTSLESDVAAAQARWTAQHQAARARAYLRHRHGADTPGLN